MKADCDSRISDIDFGGEKNTTSTVGRTSTMICKISVASASYASSSLSTATCIAESLLHPSRRRSSTTILGPGRAIISRRDFRCRSVAASGDAPDAFSFSSGQSVASASDPDQKTTASFCIIEGPETVRDFAKMELQEIQDNIKSRRNKIFLHMEEVRRLRIQQRIKNAELRIFAEEQEHDLPDFPSFIPFLPPLSPANLKQLYASCFCLIAGIIIFGGLLAPSLELKLGIGGTSYKDFIHSMHLPLQLSEVDPIVASFSGGAVGVISALMVVEINNVKQQEHKRCKYCLGTGYLACARCSSSGSVLIEPVAITDSVEQPLSAPKPERCSSCSGAGKVMCPTCLCTGMEMASEHDPRIDPFD